MAKAEVTALLYHRLMEARNAGKAEPRK